MEKHSRIAIIGSGPAGLTAAIYLARAELRPVVFDGLLPGGQLMLTSDIGNYPGFPEDISGQQLMSQMRQQAERFGTEFLSGEVTAVDITQRPFTLSTSMQTVTADSVIIATGASPRYLGLESEQRLMGRGVSACATCDGFFFKGKDIAIVGGGDTALEEATFLTKFAKSVSVIVRKGEADMRASKIMIARAKSNEKISFIYHSEVVEVLGDRAVEGIRIKNERTNAERVLTVQGLFVAIGHKPNTDFLGNAVELTKGYIKVTNHTNTSVEGVFAAGDVQDWWYRQAIAAAGFGCMAALDAEKYLAQHPSI
ncbi:MAG: thioredoxin-disulfide reductase [Patescibacteria group bacterium]